MEIMLKNNCSYDVLVTFDMQSSIELQPYSTIHVNCKETEVLEISIKCNNLSHFKKNKYNFTIETRYSFINVKPNTVFIITNELNSITPNVLFNRLYINTDTATCCKESYNVYGAEKLKKSFKKSRLLHFMFFDPLEYLTGLAIVFLIIGIILSYKFGWKLALIYFPSTYVILLIINFITEYIFNFILKKGFKSKDEKTEFYNYFENDYISQYYANSHDDSL